MNQNAGRTHALVFAALLALVLLSFWGSIATGPVALGLPQLVASLNDWLLGLPAANSDAWVVRELRLPRAMLAAVMGAALALAGAVTQGVFRNPLADPGLLGIASGAALAAVAVIVLQHTWLAAWTTALGPLALPLAAFLGGMGVMALIYRLGTRAGQTHIAILLLAGIAINVLAGALTGLLVYVADDQQLRTLTFWSMGSLAHGHWWDVIALSVCVALPMVWIMCQARALNALMLGENVAQHLGFRVQQLKFGLLLTVALLTGASVAIAGTIGFLGLVVPHLMRLGLGADHRLLLPASALGGASLLLLADCGARLWVAPAELPIGLVMALLGGPVFLLILLQQARQWMS